MNIRNMTAPFLLFDTTKVIKTSRLCGLLRSLILTNHRRHWNSITVKKSLDKWRSQLKVNKTILIEVILWKLVYMTSSPLIVHIGYSVGTYYRANPRSVWLRNALEHIIYGAWPVYFEHYYNEVWCNEMFSFTSRLRAPLVWPRFVTDREFFLIVIVFSF